MTPRPPRAAELSDDCPCPGIFKSLAWCGDCPYRATEPEVTA